MCRRVLTALLILALLAAFCAAAVLPRRFFGAQAAQGTPDAAADAPGAAPTPLPDAALRISEVMSSNDSCIVDGAVCDWVELVNAGTEPVALGDYYLSQSEWEPFACRLPERTLAPGAYVVLRSGLELSFRISRAGEELFLSRSDGLRADALSVPALETDSSYTRDGGVTRVPTPGAANLAGDTPPAADTSRLCISEIVPANASYWPVNGRFYDLVELYNGSGKSVALDGYYLSDSKTQLQRWQLPAVKLAPGEYYVAVCSGLGGDQAPFRLSAEGETVYLSTDAGAVDALACPAVPRDRSWGRSAAGAVYFAAPTPGAPNGSGYPTLSSQPAASIASGIYESPFSVTLSGTGTIRYTTDGSTPNAASAVYGGEEIAVTGSMSLRAYCQDGDHIPSGVVTWNYFLNIPDYELDIVKVSLSPSQFSGPLSQIRNADEFSANIALYHQGREEFSSPCGISIFGSGSRVYGKRSYQIDFSSLYGPTKLHYQIFDSRAQTDFDTLVLRSGSQDQAYATMRDELLTSLFDECSDSLVTLAYRPVNLYVNSEYRGVYYIRERTCEKTFAAQDGCGEESVGIVKDITFRYGAKDQHGIELRALLNTIRRSDMSVEENYRAVESALDIDSTIDFFIAQMWSTNYDIGNARMIRTAADGGKWRFLLYDLDVAFLKTNETSVTRMVTAYDGLLAALLRNEEFLTRFTQRLGELLRGPLREDAVLARLDAFAARIDPDMHYNCERWKGLCSYDKWLAQVALLREGKNIGIQGWTPVLIRQYIAAVHPPEELIRSCFGEEFLS